MGLLPSFDDSGTGISKISVGTIIKDRLESTWDQTKTDNTIKASEIYFDSSNQDFPAEYAKTKPVVLRVHSARTLHTDLEIGLTMIRYVSRPTINVFAYDLTSTKNGIVSPLLEDMAQYVRRFVAENLTSFQPQGLHSVVGIWDDYIANNGDPNWHHWTMQLEVEYEMRRTSP